MNTTAGRSVKIAASLCMVVGIVGLVAGSEPFAWLLLIGFLAFVVGRFME